MHPPYNIVVNVVGLNYLPTRPINTLKFLYMLDLWPCNQQRSCVLAPNQTMSFPSLTGLHAARSQVLRGLRVRCECWEESWSSLCGGLVTLR